MKIAVDDVVGRVEAMVERLGAMTPEAMVRARPTVELLAKLLAETIEDFVTSQGGSQEEIGATVAVRRVLSLVLSGHLTGHLVRPAGNAGAGTVAAGTTDPVAQLFRMIVGRNTEIVEMMTARTEQALAEFEKRTQVVVSNTSRRIADMDRVMVAHAERSEKATELLRQRTEAIAREVSSAGPQVKAEVDRLGELIRRQAQALEDQRQVAVPIMNDLRGAVLKVRETLDDRWLARFARLVDHFSKSLELFERQSKAAVVEMLAAGEKIEALPPMLMAAIAEVHKTGEIVQANGIAGRLGLPPMRVANERPAGDEAPKARSRKLKPSPLAPTTKKRP